MKHEAKPAKVRSETKRSRDWGIIRKKDRSGSYQWYARIVRADASGRKRQFVAKADNKTHARQLRDEMELKFARSGPREIDGDRITFRQLAESYRKRRVIPPEYHQTRDGLRKVAGLRSYQSVGHYIDTLVAHFGRRRIRDISHADIEDFKRQRLKTPTRRGERSIADVNRTLAQMRCVMRFAVQNGWLHRSPFELGVPLISLGDEIKRERVLTFAEEERFLAACEATRVVEYVRDGKAIKASIAGGRGLIRTIFLTAIDTAMRRGELLKLKWEDVNLDARLITVTVTSSKTARARTIGMTTRVLREFEELAESTGAFPGENVFRITDFKRSFAAICREAELEDLRFHDLRHTAITRMVNAGLPAAEVMKISGHTQWTTFARYVNPTTDTVRKVANVLSEYVAVRATSASPILHSNGIQ